MPPGICLGPSLSAIGDRREEKAMLSDREAFLVTLERITITRARILREIADGRAGPEAAASIGISYNGFRSHVSDLKVITGCEDVRELGRWWRDFRDDWVRIMASAAGRDQDRGTDGGVS